METAILPKFSNKTDDVDHNLFYDQAIYHEFHGTNFTWQVKITKKVNIISMILW